MLLGTTFSRSGRMMMYFSRMFPFRMPPCVKLFTHEYSTVLTVGITLKFVMLACDFRMLVEIRCDRVDLLQRHIQEFSFNYRFFNDQ